MNHFDSLNTLTTSVADTACAADTTSVADTACAADIPIDVIEDDNDDNDANDDYDDDDPDDDSDNEDCVYERRPVDESEKPYPPYAKRDELWTKLTPLQAKYDEYMAKKYVYTDKFEEITFEIFRSQKAENSKVIQKNHSQNKEQQNIIERIKKELDQMTANIIRASNLRGKEPNFDIEPIQNMRARIANAEAKIIPDIYSNIPFPFVAKWENWDDFIKYHNKYIRDTFDVKIAKYQDKIDSLNKELFEIERIILEDEWRPAYEKYAKQKGFWTNEYDIFKDCNKYCVDGYIYSQDYFDCPFDCCGENEEIYYIDDDGVQQAMDRHVVSCDGGRCTRGYKVNVGPKECCEKIIGLIGAPNTWFQYVEIERV